MSNLLDLPPRIAGEVSNLSDPRVSDEFLIHGVTLEGKPFRPSDWSERLCGVMSCFRPDGVVSGRDQLLGYSPFVRPVTVDGVKCVLVHPALREVEVMALDFVVNFARDNCLKVTAAQSALSGS